MNKKIKLSILTLGSMGAVVAPITNVVACNKSNNIHGIDKKPALIVDSMNTTDVDAVPQFKPQTLQDAAKSIGWKDQVWKNGYLCESVSQLINLILNLAEEYGFDPAASTESNFVITDDMIGDAAEVKNSYSAKMNGTDEENLNTIDTLIELKSANDKPSADQKLAANLTGGNQTFDDENDFKRSNLFYDEAQVNDKSTAISRIYDVKPLTIQWYGKNGEQYDAITAHGKITRLIASKGLAQQYPIINAQNGEFFLKEYAPFVKAILYKIVSQLQDVLPLIGALLPAPTLVNAIQFLVDQFTKKDPATGEPNVVSVNDPEISLDLFKKLNEINEKGNVNFLAIKALYVGYDQSFTQGGYEIWASSKWIPQDDQGNPQPAIEGYADGIKKDESSAMRILMSGWSGGRRSGYFNPVKSIQENYQADENKNIDMPTLN